MVIPILGVVLPLRLLWMMNVRLRICLKIKKVPVIFQFYLLQVKVHFHFLFIIIFLYADEPFVLGPNSNSQGRWERMGH